VDPFNIAKWYWTLDGNTTHVYSSAIGDLVPVGDPTYVAWLARPTDPPPNRPTRIKTIEELAEVLAPSREVARPIPPALLDAYKEAQSRLLTPIDVTPKVVHFVYNEVRTLQGLPILTFEQFRQAIKDRM
jgi:hypothetical protein